MAENDSEGERPDSSEDDDAGQNQYGGDSGDVDAEEQTERIEDE